MKNKTVAVSGSLLILLLAPGLTGAQQNLNPEKMSEQAIVNIILHEKAGTNKSLRQAVTGQYDGNDRSFEKLADSYLVAACYSKSTQYMISNQLENFESAKVQAKSAAQASQVASEASLKLQAYQVAQNQRIIQLLETLVSKP